jgi:hypothetical protein
MTRALSLVLAGGSLALTFVVVVVTDAVVLALSTEPPTTILVGLLLLNLGCLLQPVVGAVIEVRRPGHRIGRLLLLGGPLYAVLAAGWTTAELLEPVVDPAVYEAVNWAGLLLSYPGMALIAGWIPLLFPTGHLPGPRWRLPAATLVVLSAIGLAAWAVRPGPLVEGEAHNPFGIPGWPPGLQSFIDLIPIELVALFMLAAAALVVRYRRGTPVERLQIRWLLPAIALIVVGFAGVFVEQAIRGDDEAVVSVLVAYGGILLLTVAIGFAVLRHRLYEIDRIISRTIGWALVTGILVAVFASFVVGLQALLGGITQGDTLAVAASTLVAYALFQPVRRRVQRAVDRRFDRARYDGEQVVGRLGVRLRDNADLWTVASEVDRVARETVRPTSVAVWLRHVPGATRPRVP